VGKAIVRFAFPDGSPVRFLRVVTPKLVSEVVDLAVDRDATRAGKSDGPSRRAAGRRRGHAAQGGGRLDTVETRILYFEM